MKILIFLENEYLYATQIEKEILVGIKWSTISRYRFKSKNIYVLISKKFNYNSYKLALRSVIVKKSINYTLQRMEIK